MKKTFTKIAAALSAAVLGALPMANAFTASAATPANEVKTYRTYWYYSGGASQTKRVDVEFYTRNPLKVQGGARTNNCLNGWMDYETGSGTQYGVLHYKRWKTNDINSGVGTMFKTVSEIKSSSRTHDDLFSNCTITAYDANDNVIPYTEYSFSPSTYLVGDINGDGEVGLYDWVMLKAIVDHSYVPTTGITIRASDIDGDGDQDATDVQFLEGYLQGWYTLTQIQA